ncbi:MAG: response regulator [Neobacillus sp.]|jgi:two-component system, response regulator YesN
MYEVVLVDDDVIVIEFLKKVIPWQDYGFQVIAHFQDSSDALAYLQEQPYDVLITDIGMPKLNGIELIEQLKKSQMSSYQIILSCHDEFRFAQQALKLGVYDYILKETMEEMDIIALLERLKTTLDQEQNTKNPHIQITKFIETNNLGLKIKFIDKLLEQNLDSTDWWTEFEEPLGVDFSNRSYTPVLCFIDHFQEAVSHYENETWLQYRIKNIAEEVLAEIEVFFLQGKFFMLFPVRSNKTMETLQLVRELNTRIRTSLNFTITSVIGEQNVKHREFIVNMRLLLKNSDQRFYYQYNSIQFYLPILYASDSIFHNYVEISQKLKELILKGKKDEVVACISQELSNIREKKYSPEAIKDWVTKIVFDVKLSLNALKHFETQSIPLTDYFLQNVETFEHLETVLEKVWDKFLDHLNSFDLTTRNEDVLKAQKYVQTHLGDKISLTEVAAHLHLNASYFSRMYKKETGEGFVEYVTRVKMEKAIELLDHSNKSVEQIAYELGFESKSYFLKTFKRFYGISPKSYKNKGCRQNSS